MLRTIVAGALALAFAIGLAGCVTTQDPGAGPVATTPTGQQVEKVVNQVQSTTATLCSFVPTATTIASIFYAGANTVGDIAQVVCNAITKKSLVAGRKPTAVVNGRRIAIQGRRV